MASMDYSKQFGWATHLPGQGGGCVMSMEWVGEVMGSIGHDSRKLDVGVM